MRQLDKGLQKGFYVCVQVVSVSVAPNLLFHSFIPLLWDTAPSVPSTLYIWSILSGFLLLKENKYTCC